MAEVKYLDKTGLGTVWSKVKGIVTPKADKVSGATAGHLAGLNSSGNLTDSGLPASNIAQKDGSYSGMTVGAAEDLVSAESVASEFTSRITGGSTTVGKGGTALVDKIKGRTLVWNQLVPNGNFADGDVSWFFVSGGTHTVANGVLSYSWTSAYSRQGIENLNCVITASHKYYIAGTIKNLANTRRRYYIGQAYAKIYADDYFEASERKRISKIVTATAASGTPGNYFAIFGTVDVENSVEATDIVCIDLTLMFGAGNEPATVAEFEALYPLPYYGYNPGKLINNGLQSEYDLAWNQLLANGNFANGTTGWSQYNSTISASNGELTIVKSTGSVSTGGFARTSITGDTTHKYYMACDAEMLTSGVELYLGFHTTGGTVGGNAMASTVSSSYIRISQVASPVSSTDTLSIRVGAAAAPGDSTGKAKNVILVDLTLMFGAGNEPDSPEEFEAMFPNDYYPYDTGTEQHFSFPQFKTAIETVGWNIWDEEWEVGGYNNSDGSKSSSANYRRGKSAIPVTPSTTYYYHSEVNRSLYYIPLDINGNVISVPPALSNNSAFTTPSNCVKILIQFYVASTAWTTDERICISLSDPSRNGTYEPYWRSELELGLGDIKVKSHNVWDEEWEAGGLDATTGQNYSTSNVIRAKNYTPVTGGQSYYIYMGSASISQAISMRYYDANKNFLGTTDKNGNSNGANLVRVMPDNCAYIRFATSSYYGSSTTYLRDICINLSDPAYNGRYEPYGDGGVISITGGLKSAGTVYDEISGGKLVKRIESVDLGTSTWAAVSDTSYPNRFKSVISGIAVTGNNLIPRYINKGIGGYGSGINEDKSFNQTSTTINVHDSSYTDVATFKASLAGVPLYFELAQPIEYELAEAIPTAMRNDPYGTERRLPEDTAAIVTAPFRADITYSTNIKEAVQSMHQNFINVNSMQDFLAELGTLMGGTWTMRPADGKFDFTFTPNPSNE